MHPKYDLFNQKNNFCLFFANFSVACQPCRASRTFDTCEQPISVRFRPRWTVVRSPSSRCQRWANCDFLCELFAPDSRWALAHPWKQAVCIYDEVCVLLFDIGLELLGSADMLSILDGRSYYWRIMNVRPSALNEYYLLSTEFSLHNCITFLIYYIKQLSCNLESKREGVAWSKHRDELAQLFISSCSSAAVHQQLGTRGWHR